MLEKLLENSGYKLVELDPWEVSKFPGAQKWERKLTHDNGGGLRDDQLEPEVDWPVYFSDFAADIVQVEKAGFKVVDVQVSEFQQDYYGHHTDIALYIAVP